MSTAPFRFRYVNEIVGTFVLLSLGLLLAGIVLVGVTRQWFKPDFVIETVFPPEGTFEVEKGTQIKVRKTRVGTVKDIVIAEDGSIKALLTIQSDYARFVRSDSIALVKKQFGVAGDVFIEITSGSGAPLPEEGATLPIQKDTELLDTVELVVERVQNSIVPAIEEVKKTLAEYRGLAADLRSPDSNLQQAVATLNETAQGFNRLIDGLNKGEGTAGKFLREPAVHDETQRILVQVNQVLEQVRGTLKQVDGIVNDLKQTSATLPSVARTVQGEMEDVPGVVLQTQTTLREAEKTLVGVQRHWLLRQYMAPEHPLDPIPLDAVGGAEGGAP